MDDLNPPTSSSTPPPRPNSPEQNTPSADKTNWLRWIVLIVFVAFLSSAGTYLILQSQKPPPSPAEVSTKAGPTPTPDPTANWNVYTNNKYKYSVRYPDFITLKSDYYETGIVFYYKKDELESRPIFEFPAYYTNGLSFYFRSDPATEAPKHELPRRPVQEVKINNSKGVKIVDSDLDYYLSSKTGDYSIRIIYQASKNYQTEEEIKERLKIYNQILQTFKFLE